jgi:hypothetical protein
MDPVEPFFKKSWTQDHVVYAKDQKEYRPLPAIVDQDGTVITEWELTDEEREALFMGGRIRLTLLYVVRDRTGERVPLCPIKIEALEPEHKDIG